MMRIDVADLKRSPGENIHLELESPLPALEVDGEKVSFEGPARASLDISNTGKGLLVEGQVGGRLKVNCARCLEPFLLPVETFFSETYYPEGSEEVNQEEREEWIPFSGDILDITSEVLKSILMGLPMKLVCQPDCRGLCPRCGQNLNIAPCGCDREDLDPRLAVLKDLLKGE